MRLMLVSTSACLWRAVCCSLGWLLRLGVLRRTVSVDLLNTRRGCFCVQTWINTVFEEFIHTEETGKRMRPMGI